MSPMKMARFNLFNPYPGNSFSVTIGIDGEPSFGTISPSIVYKIEPTDIFNIFIKGKTVMKTTLQMIGCLGIVFFLSTGTMLSASGKLSDETQKKERTKSSGWIGIMIQDVNEKIGRKAMVNSEEGAYVKEVIEESPADSTGIQEGDIIIEFNGKILFDSDELMKIVRRTSPGTTVDIVIVRDGQKKTLTLTVGKNKESKHHMFGAVPDIPDMHIFIGNRVLGMQLPTLNEQLGEYFGVPNNEGVLIEEVKRQSAAEKAGFKPGDIIIRVGNKTVDEVERIQKELRKYEEGNKVEFEVIRKGAKKTLSIDMEKNQSFPQNFFFRKPHIRMFRINPFDDAEMHLDMDELRSNLDQVQIELRKSIKNNKEIELEIQKHEQRLLSPPEPLKL
jgi:membrane-associated protease RseP (regulator of RpoE activity)